MPALNRSDAGSFISIAYVTVRQSMVLLLLHLLFLFSLAMSMIAPIVDVSVIVTFENFSLFLGSDQCAVCALGN